jgi:hypothetical protein
MLVLKSILFAGLCVALPAVASQQTPATPAKTGGDEPTEVEQLQAIVAEQVRVGATFFPPGPARRLSALYAVGGVVPRDLVLACSLASYAQVMAGERTERYDAVCDTLAEPERSAARNLFDCFLFGLEPGAMRVGSDTVIVDRLGLRLAETDPAGDHRNFWGGGTCGPLVARLQSRTVTPPDGAAPGVRSRSFVDLLTWRTMGMATEPAVRYILHWTMFEVQSGKVKMLLDAPIRTATTWPRPALPPDTDSAITLEMVRSGNVRWRHDGAPPMRGWLLIEEGDAR